MAAQSPLQQEAELVEQLNQAVKLTQKLRSTVTKVFDDLSSGLSDTRGNEKALLNGLQKTLLAVNNDFSELEKLGSSINHDGIGPAANSSHLNLDPGLDKASLYSQLLQSYKWTNRVTEHAIQGNILLTQNSLKRSSLGTTPRTKRLRRGPSVNHAIPTQQVDSMIPALNRQFPLMNIEVHRPLGTSTILLITLGKTLKTMIAIRGLVIEWVRVKAHSEDFFSEDGKLELWSKSRYNVFQKVTEHAGGAMLHFSTVFCHPLPEVTLRSFLMWLNTYQNLFSAICNKCGKHLQDGLPPTWRDLRSCAPAHEPCR